MSSVFIIVWYFGSTAAHFIQTNDDTQRYITKVEHHYSHAKVNSKTRSPKTWSGSVSWGQPLEQ
ncbi:hypothetical protein SK128_021866 [Halocaridina rubra]|uniref:Secreted protein n=1 Tax=Halocaridina rubra TaxID=373956 RepID=A0AAN8WLY8_HALRR